MPPRTTTIAPVSYSITEVLTQRILGHVSVGADERLARYATTLAVLRTEAASRGWS